MATERIEVITRTERRRRWSSADKVRLVMATREPGATVSSVAREHGVSESLLYSWRGRLARTTAVGADLATSSGFAPVCVVDGRPAPVMVAGDGGVVAATIEIELPNGCRLRVHERIATSTLRKMLTVLGGIRPGC
jgi:transposase